MIFLYILDDETPGDWPTGGASRWWLHRSLQSMGNRVRLILRRGSAGRVLEDVIREVNAGTVHFTRDYAPWADNLERRVKTIAENAGATCHRHGGYLLHEPETIRSGSGGPFKVYTPFARACLALGDPRPPQPAPEFQQWTGDIQSDNLDGWKLLPERPNWASGFETLWEPGEAGGRARLAGFIADGLAAYASDRDRPDREVTSRLSPHLHFGEISPAQCWHAVRSAQSKAGGKRDAAAEKFLRELLWREFSYHLLHAFPELPSKPLRPAFENFPWTDDRAGLRAWQKGQTGYPIVDAGMRQLWATGTMHNRVRMIAASFLIKHLLVPWTEGERWFWDTLVDADLASNAASWQWVAGSGADAAPWFRIFNPVLQGEKFDGEGNYVRRWVPELTALPDKFIHRPWDAPAGVLASAGIELGVTYPYPVVEHGAARQRALAAFRELT